MQPFDTLPLDRKLIEHLHSVGFSHATPVQSETIPYIIEGKDLIARAETGSGKTMAFALPIVQKCDTTQPLAQALIIAPTRELADQIADTIRTLCAYRPNLKVTTLYGGVPLRTQTDALKQGTHILVATPGRTLDHLGKGTLNLSSIKQFVLDEADKMLQMGFIDDILSIAAHLPSSRQSLLFSATFSPKIEALAQSILKNPVHIDSDTLHSLSTIEERVCTVTNKYKTLETLIGAYRPRSLLLFINTKTEVSNLYRRLISKGHDVVALHGDLDQDKRDEALIRFRNGSCRIMVATDIASRGLDIDGVDMVVNYDLPFDESTYIHRIGRTGRSGMKGLAVSFHTAGSIKTAYVFHRASELKVSSLSFIDGAPLKARYDTIRIGGGKKSKLRKGDIVGTLCKEVGLFQNQIGTITILSDRSYVAIETGVSVQTYAKLKLTKIKKRKYLVSLLKNEA